MPFTWGCCWHAVLIAATGGVAGALASGRREDVLTTLFGVAAIGLGVALIGVGAAAVRSSDLLSGVAAMGGGVAAIGVGGLLLAGHPPVRGWAGSLMSSPVQSPRCRPRARPGPVRPGNAAQRRRHLLCASSNGAVSCAKPWGRPVGVYPSPTSGHGGQAVRLGRYGSLMDTYVHGS
jgi:hypothetical protein